MMNDDHEVRKSMTLASIRDAVSHLTRLDDFNYCQLSAGFFSQVFKVTHKSTRKVMVMKMNKTVDNRGNALKEIELLNKLNHENIVAFMGCVVHEGQLHPLMEYLNGGNLEKFIKLNANCANSSQLFAKLACDVARGMSYLHKLKYIHRDLTSKNILIRKRDANKIMDIEPEDVTAVISDFGFTVSEPGPGDPKLDTVGSPYWLAPECLRQAMYNHKSDIFSFGIICCELNYIIPADPDYLPRDDQFCIRFDKLTPQIDTLLNRVAQFACQPNPEERPEFSAIVRIFESEGNATQLSSAPSDATQPLNGHNSPLAATCNGAIDIFDQHLIRRRNSVISSNDRR